MRVCKGSTALSLLSLHWNVKHMEEGRGEGGSPSMRKARHVLTGLPAISILSTQTHPLGYQIPSLFVCIYVLCVHENASNDSLAPTLSFSTPHLLMQKPGEEPPTRLPDGPEQEEGGGLATDCKHLRIF